MLGLRSARRMAAPPTHHNDNRPPPPPCRSEKMSTSRCTAGYHTWSYVAGALHGDGVHCSPFRCCDRKRKKKTLISAWPPGREAGVQNIWETAHAYVHTYIHTLGTESSPSAHPPFHPSIIHAGSVACLNAFLCVHSLCLCVLFLRFSGIALLCVPPLLLSLSLCLPLSPLSGVCTVRVCVLCVVCVVIPFN